MGRDLYKCRNDLKRSKVEQSELQERFKDLEQMQGKITTQLVKQVKLFKRLALPTSEDEYTSHSENEYGHSEEEFLARCHLML